MKSARIFRSNFFMPLLALVASCGTMVTYQEAADSLRDARVCCESMAQFKYEPLTEGEGIRFNLDASSDAFAFATGKSYFKALRLPDREIPYRVRIRSFALGETVDNAHIFFPQIALLNDRFAVVGQSSPGDFSLRKTDIAGPETWGVPLKFEGSILINNPNVKYLVVFTTPALMQRTEPHEVINVVPVILPGVVGAVPAGKRTVRIRHSSFGLLHIEISASEGGNHKSNR